MRVSLLGDLNQRIIMSLMMKTRIHQKVLLSYFYQIVVALESAHGKNICHGDIKPHNIVVDTYNSAKLFDFRCSE